jgi:hypothetical protein
MIGGGKEHEVLTDTSKPVLKLVALVPLRTPTCSVFPACEPRKLPE